MIEDLIKVLWIEDDPGQTEAYPAEAEVFGLHLHPYSCWDDAKEALEKDFDSWEAIILDAKCKHHRDSADNAMKFLGEALSGLNRLFAKHQHTINWYILSGGSDEELNDLILDERKSWDGDWPKLYYSKTTDREALFERIKKQVEHSTQTQVKTQYFRDVFEAISEAELDGQVETHMLNLLTPVVFPENVAPGDYNNRTREARIVVEYLFRGMIRMGMLPKMDRNNKKGSINLTESCRFITKAKINGENIYPETIGSNLYDIVNMVGSLVHSSPGDSTYETDKFKRYMLETGRTTYLLKSYALQLCDVILWFNNYIKLHGDTEANKKNLEYCDY